jgi:hypothetical protein
VKFNNIFAESQLLMYNVKIIYNQNMAGEVLQPPESNKGSNKPLVFPRLHVEFVEDKDDPEKVLNVILDAAKIVLEPKQKAELLSSLQRLDLKNPDQAKEQGKKVPFLERPDVLIVIGSFLQMHGYIKPKVREGGQHSDVVAESAVDNVTDQINEAGKIGKMPTGEYRTDVSVYGYQFEVRGDNIVYKPKTGKFWAVWDRVEDMMRKSGDGMGLRVRAKNMDQIWDNIEHLHLTDIFSRQKDGIGERVDDMKRGGALLDDVLRLRNGSPYLKKIDPVEALKASTKMMSDVHQKSGLGIGEVLGGDVLVHVDPSGKVKDARLSSLPDMLYHSESAYRQKASDLADLCFCAGSAAFQTESPDKAEAAALSYIRAILDSYGDDIVKLNLKEMIGASNVPAFTINNETRLGFNHVKDHEGTFKKVRKMILDELDKV